MTSGEGFTTQKYKKDMVPNYQHKSLLQGVHITIIYQLASCMLRIIDQVGEQQFAHVRMHVRIGVHLACFYEISL